jgi:hypothetical protein
VSSASAESVARAGTAPRTLARGATTTPSPTKALQDEHWRAEQFAYVLGAGDSPTYKGIPEDASFSI